MRTTSHDDLDTAVAGADPAVGVQPRPAVGARRGLVSDRGAALTASLLCLAACGAPEPDPPQTLGTALAATARPEVGGVSEAATLFAWPSCGSTTFDYRELYYGGPIAVAPDGTVYHAMSDGGESYISRYRPGQPAERTWAHVGPSNNSSVSHLAVDPSGTPYALVSNYDRKQIQLGRVLGGAPPAIVPLGAPGPDVSGPTSLAFTHDSVLLEAGFRGVARVDRATGRRTQVSPPLMLRELYFVGPRTARGVTYDHGLVELTFDGGVTRSTYRTIFPFETLALQFTGIDQLGRPYALIHEGSADKLVRFDSSFRSRETLYQYPTVSGALARFAFGRGALRCDVLLTGFSLGRVVPGSTPGVP